MSRERVVSQEPLPHANLAELQGALTKLNAAARMASVPQLFQGSSTVLVEDEDGWNLTGLALVEERLSDGSKVFKVRLLFASHNEIPPAVRA